MSFPLGFHFDRKKYCKINQLVRRRRRWPTTTIARGCVGMTGFYRAPTCGLCNTHSLKSKFCTRRHLVLSPSHAAAPCTSCPPQLLLATHVHVIQPLNGVNDIGDSGAVFTGCWSCDDGLCRSERGVCRHDRSLLQRHTRHMAVNGDCVSTDRGRGKGGPWRWRT